MNEITLLSQETIDKIAAGEVVERPSSIVKELVENAIDAGANAVTVEIRDGGVSLVRITDNGSGIPKEQVRTAFLRHATSKIRSVDDLLSARTLGFRGEALSSIAAVCQVEMITKTPGSLTGTRYVIEGGAEKTLDEIGAPEGTTFLVRNLFYNTPARRKFLKTAATEAGYVSDLMERMALSHPSVSFKFINNGDTKLHTSGNCSLRDIIYGIYGREITANIVKLDADAGSGLHITGFIGKPAISRGNRNFENYFVNGRYIKSAVVAKAIEDAYKPFIMNHRFPFTVLMLQMDSAQVDVNVHPAKMEVRFADQSGVYEQVCQAVKDGLLGKELIPEITIEGPKPSSGHAQNQAGAARPSLGHTQKQTGSGSLSSEHTQTSTSQGSPSSEHTWTQANPGSPSLEHTQTQSGPGSSSSEYAQAQAGQGNAAAGAPSRPAQKFRYPEPFEKVRSRLIAEAESPYEAKYPQRTRGGMIRPVTGNIGGGDTGAAQALAGSTGKDAAQIPAGQIPAASERTAEIPVSGKPVQMELFDNRLLSEEGMKKHRLIGQLFETYWLIEYEEKLYIIDQHAAHEKVLYERFMEKFRKKEQTSQMITPPLIVTLSMQEEAALKQNLEHFTSAGFVIEPFGGHDYSVSAVPGDLCGIADRTVFMEMLDGLTDVSEKASEQAILEKIASMSCKAAVKGNHRMSAKEADALIAELLTLENPYNCPHGRPTIVAMTKQELEKKFKRIV